MARSPPPPLSLTLALWLACVFPEDMLRSETEPTHCGLVLALSFYWLAYVRLGLESLTVSLISTLRFILRPLSRPTPPTCAFGSCRRPSSCRVIDIKCPMKSFRIPMSRMQLSEDALKTALEVDSFRDAEEFLDAFGSHVSNGRQEVQHCTRKYSDEILHILFVLAWVRLQTTHGMCKI